MMIKCVSNSVILRTNNDYVAYKEKHLSITFAFYYNSLQYSNGPLFRRAIIVMA